jgi:hypothetical protein
MRRRFGRGRKRNEGNEETSSAPIDAGEALARLAEAKVGEGLEAVELAGVSPAQVVLATGSDSGTDLAIGYSPTDGGAALLGALALARSKEGFAGRAVAAAPCWSDAARRRLALLRESLPFTVRALAAGGAGLEVSPGPIDDGSAGTPAQLARGLSRSEDRRVFERAVASLEGLAAKHGGVVQATRERVDLLLLASRAASLSLAGARVRLEVLAGERSTHDLDGEGLATAFDRLEGALRKRMNDRRVRGSEEGLRASLLPHLERAAGLEVSQVWPLLTGDVPQLDLVGVDGEGRFVACLSRERVGLADLGEALDAAFDSRLRVPLLSQGGVAIKGAPRVVLAGREFDATALSLLELFDLSIAAYDVSAKRGGELRLEPREQTTPPPRASKPAPPRAAAGAATAATAGASAGRAGGGAPRAKAAPDAGAKRDADSGAQAGDKAGGIEEMSLFDLDDDGGPEGGDGEPRRRRSRGGRRRGRRPRGEGEAEAESRDAEPANLDAGSDDGEGGGGRGRGRGRRRGRGRSGGGSDRESAGPERDSGDRTPPAPEASDDEGLVDDETLAPLAADVPEMEAVDLSYEDEDSSEEGDEQADKQRKDRELRRHARVAKAEPEPARPPRRRAAFVAHADRVSVLTAVLLARDVRLVEGFWVYPQEDLMTFFRSIATDLRDETPIFLIGFNASPPARDTIQAASLYRGRLHWFDHHPWPPEDLESLRSSIGEDCVHVDAGADSSLAAVISERTRRSRFSDKLVELVTGRFTQHDYERWGRLWWHRSGEIAKKRGALRSEVDALLAGRPSDLAKEAARIEPPPPPPEVEFVSTRDFRLVHFGGYVMVVLEVPPEMDLHLSARIARERYEAQLSLAYREGTELLVLGGDDSRAKRGLDLGSMADHLASKHEWITAMRDDDHVARVLVRDLQTVPGRLDEVVSEIAMGRSIVEG